MARIKLHKYIGETSRSSYERGNEHQNDMRQLNPGSHMLRHALDQHGGEALAKVEFGMEVIKSMRSSWDRQMLESVTIQQNTNTHHILNSRSEYNRCSLPRLSTRLGDSDFKKYEKELEIAKKKEEGLEHQIRNMRKARNKLRRTRSQKTVPPAKRRKTGSETSVRECTTWMTRLIEETGDEEDHDQVDQAEKRKEDGEMINPKAKKMRMDIRRYTTASRRTEDEQQAAPAAPQAAAPQGSPEVTGDDKPDKIDARTPAIQPKDQPDEQPEDLGVDEQPRDPGADEQAGEPGDEEQSPDTHHITQSSAILEAVARLVSSPVINLYEQPLTKVLMQGTDQAEQEGQAEQADRPQEGWQAEQGPSAAEEAGLDQAEQADQAVQGAKPEDEWRAEQGHRAADDPMRQTELTPRIRRDAMGQAEQDQRDTAPSTMHMKKEGGAEPWPSAENASGGVEQTGQRDKVPMMGEQMPADQAEQPGQQDKTTTLKSPTIPGAGHRYVGFHAMLNTDNRLISKCEGTPVPGDQADPKQSDQAEQNASIEDHLTRCHTPRAEEGAMDHCTDCNCLDRWDRVSELWDESDRLVQSWIAHAKGDAMTPFQLDGRNTEELRNSWKWLANLAEACTSPTCNQDVKKMLMITEKNLNYFEEDAHDPTPTNPLATPPTHQPTLTSTLDPGNAEPTDALQCPTSSYKTTQPTPPPTQACQDTARLEQTLQCHTNPPPSPRSKLECPDSEWLRMTKDCPITSPPTITPAKETHPTMGLACPVSTGLNKTLNCPSPSTSLDHPPPTPVHKLACTGSAKLELTWHYPTPSHPVMPGLTSIPSKTEPTNPSQASTPPPLYGTCANLPPKPPPKPPPTNFETSKKTTTPSTPAHSKENETITKTKTRKIINMWQELDRDQKNQMKTVKVVDFGLATSRRTRSRSSTARTPSSTSSPARTRRRTPAQVQTIQEAEEETTGKRRTQKMLLLTEENQTLVKTTILANKVKTESAKIKKITKAVSSPFKKRTTPARRRDLADGTSKNSSKPVTQRPDIRSLIFNWEEITKLESVLTPAVIRGPKLEPKP